MARNIMRDLLTTIQRMPVTGRQACLPEYLGTGQNERFVPPGIFLSFSLIGVLIG
jgi:hypothetical protein